MKYLVPLFFILNCQTTHASWIGKTCTRLFSFIAVDDPRQYEEVRTDALLLYYGQLGIKGAWNRLEPQEAISMNIMGAELRWRLSPVMSQFESPENIQRINDAVWLYGGFEGEAVEVKR